LAEIWGVSEAEVLERMTENFTALFGSPP